MRTYPTNSPKAICRLLALTMIVDGHLAPRELKALHHSGLLRRLEVSEDTFDETVGELCQDLLASSADPDAGMVEIEPELLDRLLDEIDSPLLRICLLKGMLEIARADAVIDHRERRLLRRATYAWTEAEVLDADVA
ncbi:tellurite resistance TerB family protein [Massilia niastensis]|uniref:tellurite resistance TerB family protein n=1 Tax=Massilia niastensis TaxID=544911 RepID=UPI00036D6A62|nr:TerB family tellurite resistance protein [Massilia niastensis]